MKRQGFLTPGRMITSVWASLLILSVLVSCATQETVVDDIPELDRLDTAAELLASGEDLTDRYRLAEARESFLEALAVYGSLDNRDGTVSTLLALGWNAWQSGDPAAAGAYYHQARQLADAGVNAVSQRDVRNHQADVHLRLGDSVEALNLLETGPVETGDTRVDAARLRLLGTVRDSLGSTEEGLTLLEEAWSVASVNGELNEEAQASYRTAVILSRMARFEEAEIWALRALAADRAAAYPPGIAADLRALAIISMETGNQEAAEDYYRRAWLAWNGIGRQSSAEEARRSLESLTGRTEYLP